MLRGTVSALLWVHGLVVVHDDIKLGDVVLADFGLSTDNPSDWRALWVSVESGSSARSASRTIVSISGLNNFYLATAKGHLAFVLACRCEDGEGLSACNTRA